MPQDKKNFDEASNQEYADLANLKKLGKYTKPWVVHLVITGLLMIVIVASSLVQPYIIKRSLDDYLNPNKVGVELSADGFPAGEKKFTITQAAPEALDNYIETQNYRQDDQVTILHWQGESITLSQEEFQTMREHRFAGLVRQVIFLGLLILLGLIASIAQHRLLFYVGQKVVYSLRSDLFNHLQHMDMAFYEKNATGRLVTRMTNDMENINELYTQVIVTFLADVGIIVGSAAMMFQLNWQLALIALTVAPILAWITFIFRDKIRQAYRIVRAKLSHINTSLSENFMGIKTIQLFNQEEKFMDEFSEINEDYRLANRHLLNLYAIFRPLVNLLYYISLFCIIYFGSRLALKQTIEIGIIIAMTLYIDRLFRPIQDLSEKFNILQSSLTSIERVFALFEETSDIPEADHPLPIDSLRGEVEFRDVRFSYVPGEEVLKGISFKAEPGETIAFVGATGAGKSTVINLLSRLYDVDSGSILLDQHDIKEYKIKDLREHIGVVLQDVFLFAGTIRDNIRLMSPNFTDAEIYQAAQYVNADRIINRYADGLDHPVTEGGTTLSAGERQLISFARALLYQPDILVLDEATASIDTETEELIQDAIQKLVENRTTFIVAHRLSTIRHADKIIVMKHGQIAESGTHDELIAKKGLYYDLYRLQYEEELYPEG